MKLFRCLEKLKFDSITMSYSLHKENCTALTTTFK